MHHIHRTKAFVLKNYASKEADGNIVLLTENFGLIYAMAQGSRKMESKMRQSIQDFSRIDAALVSGRSGWRMVNVLFINNFYTDIKIMPLRESVCKVFGLIGRLIAGEMEDREIFEKVSEFVNFATKNQNELSAAAMVGSFEVIFLANILDILGYLKKTEETDRYLRRPPTLELIGDLANSSSRTNKKLVVEIDRAIKDSHL